MAGGMVQDRSGKVTRRFTVEIDCTWRGNEGVLDESFVWSDGKLEKRIWKITKQGDNYIGTAGDIVGEAIGVASGPALQWRYILDLPVDNTTYKVNMDDWMYLIDDKTLSNRTVMKSPRVFCHVPGARVGRVPDRLKLANSSSMNAGQMILAL